MQKIMVLKILMFVFFFSLFSPSFVEAVTLDSLLAKTYDQMHNDCMSEAYIDDELVSAFMQMDTLKAMDLLKNRNLLALAKKYIDPSLLKEQTEKLQKKYDKYNAYMDLKGRGLLFDDMLNAFLASKLLIYRYMHLGAAGYGIIPEKIWKPINSNAWRLIFNFGKKQEVFYFRRLGTSWFLTDKKFVK